VDRATAVDDGAVDRGVVEPVAHGVGAHRGVVVEGACSLELAGQDLGIDRDVYGEAFLLGVAQPGGVRDVDRELCHVDQRIDVGDLRSGL
jgi:hypothetical protein